MIGNTHGYSKWRLFNHAAESVFLALIIAGGLYFLAFGGPKTPKVTVIVLGFMALVTWRALFHARVAVRLSEIIRADEDALRLTAWGNSPVVLPWAAIDGVEETDDGSLVISSSLAEQPVEIRYDIDRFEQLRQAIAAHLPAGVWKPAESESAVGAA